ncbi:MAG: bacillithiol biosynthesis BshC, partial [Vicinamibacterales bacterium]
MQSEASSPTSAALPVDIRKFPWIRRLASDYAFAYDRVAPFFAGNPAEPAAWADAIARSQAHLRAPAEIAAVLAAQQARRGAPAEAVAAAARLADPRTVVVITGQQAGLFGGPLFTLLKALTAMKLAQEVSARHAVTVVPVFWIDAEDH